MAERKSIHCSGCDTCELDFNSTSKTWSGEALSRGCAGAILEKVAEFGGSGNFPEDISPFMVGLALGRILPNCTVWREEEHGDEVYLEEFLRGLVK